MENIGVNLEETKAIVDKLKSQNVSNHKQNYEETETKIIEQKDTIRNLLMPESNQEEERLHAIASKLSAHIQTGFEKFDNVDDVIAYLEPIFQRGKVDKSYGRALILLEENALIEQAKEHFKNSKASIKLLDYILTKLIELSKDIMPKEYTEVLQIEKTYFKLLYNYN
ncbi:MAG TPA: hypothetical protein VK115_01555 [Staphylococcus sp.]|nr:hypothetical protein [Staphylococcus sp.]